MKNLTENHKKLIGKAMLGNSNSRQVAVEFEGVRYPTLRCAARATGRCYRTIRKYGVVVYTARTPKPEISRE